MVKHSKLIEYSFWSWEKGRTDWSGALLDDDEVEKKHLEKWQNKEMGRYMQYAEDNKWWYLRTNEPFDMATRVRIKKLRDRTTP